MISFPVDSVETQVRVRGENLYPLVILSPVRDGLGPIVDFTVVELNDDACNFNDKDRIDLVGRRLLELQPGYLGSDLLAAYIEVVETGRPLIVDDLVFPSAICSTRRSYDLRAEMLGANLSLMWRDVTDRSETYEHYRLLAENASEVVYETDASGILTWVSPSIQHVLGWQAEDLIGTDAVDLVIEEDLNVACDYRASIRLDEPSETVEVRLRTIDGESRWMAVHAQPIGNESGEIVSAVVGLRDCDSIVRARHDLRDSEERYRLLVDHISDVVFRAGLDSKIEWISPSVQELARINPEVVIGHALGEFIHYDDRIGMQETVAKVISGAPAFFQGRLHLARSEDRWIAVVAQPIFNDEGVTVGIVGSLRDVHDEVEARVALADSERQFRLAMESTPIGMAVEDLDRRFVQVNPALCTLVERQSEWMRSHRVPDVLDAEEDRRDLQCRAQLLSGEVDSILRESRLVRADGSRIWVEHSIGILRDETGNPLSYVSTFENVTEAKRANEKLRYQATHDSLTHLINRRELFNQAEKLLSYTQRSGNRVGALYLDVDNLKVINDTYGHTVGDRVLIEVAERLSSVGRSDDIVSRVGGDEFAILLPALHSVEDAERVAKKILAAFSDPVVFEDREIIVTVSIGVALAEPDFSIDDTLKHADLALNRAKRDGRSNSKVYVSGLD